MVALCFIHGDQYGITPAQKRCNRQQNNKHEPHRIFNLSLYTPEFTVFFHVMTEISELFFQSGVENTFYSNVFICRNYQIYKLSAGTFQKTSPVKSWKKLMPFTRRDLKQRKKICSAVLKELRFHPFAGRAKNCIYALITATYSPC